MPEIRVTDEQKRRLEEVREELAAAYVDGYGHVRPRDAIEYLLDTYTPPEGAGATAEPASGGPPDRSTSDGEVEAGDDGASLPDADATGSGAADVGGASLEAGDAGSDATTVVTSEGGDDALGAGDSRVADSLGLLDDHEDKWRRVESGDAPYEVDLPDGSTESARTKDDVRRLLFTNY